MPGTMREIAVASIHLVTCKSQDSAPGEQCQTTQVVWMPGQLTQPWKSLHEGFPA